MIRLDRVRFTAAPVDQTRLGLLGWVSAVLDDRLRVDGISVRRRLDGGLCLAWPERKDASGRRHPIIAPTDDRARLELEAEILAAVHQHLGDCA